MRAPVSIFAAPSTICARCDSAMITTHDAIGRERHRCPDCDGVATPRPRHPDDAMIPQGLVRAQPLPAIGPGQLRCQGCACGIPDTDRFCDGCRRARMLAAAAKRRGQSSDSWQSANYQERTCRGCPSVFTPSPRNRFYCLTCVADPTKFTRADGSRRSSRRVQTPPRFCACGALMPRRTGRPRRACDACLAAEAGQ